MTIGIYRLVFNNTDKCYVGQSVNIEKRFRQHISSMQNGIANCKLMGAYNSFGYPKLEVLLECSISELDDNEDIAIGILNSVDNGFNIYRYSNQAPAYSGGYGYGNTKYSKQQIIDSFKLLVDNPNITYSDVSTITKVNKDTVASIATLNQHTWLQEESPEKYAKLSNMVGKRSKQATIVSDKLSARARGIIYPKLRDPVGNVYTIDNAYRFAKEHDLAGNHLTEVLNGHRKSHKGWKICQDV